MSGARTRTRIRVLFIGGAGRSGSTLLEMLLDQIDGVTAIGEVTDIWDAGLVRGERCGCGLPFHECPFWTAVGERAFGGWDRVDAPAMLALHDRVARNRQLPKLLLLRFMPRFDAQVAEYATVLERIFEAVAEVSGDRARLVVDASKWTTHALVLRRIGALDLRIVQLVRDPRGVVHSWGRELARPHAMGTARIDAAEMRRDRPHVAALHWSVLHAGLDLIARKGVPRLIVGYDDLIAAPRQAIASIMAFAGHDPGAPGLEFTHEDRVRVQAGHGIAGNPARFSSGEITLRASERWREEMPRTTQFLVLALTGPVAYLLRRRRR